MARLLYGYKIIDGKAILDKEELEKVINLFDYYLDGLGLADAAQKAGIKRYHASIGKMLSDKRYLGDGFYDPLITQEVFDRVQLERQSRVEKLGRIFEPKEPEECPVKTEFFISQIKKAFDDPFKQAEYAYTQIQDCEVDKNGGK